MDPSVDQRIATGTFGSELGSAKIRPKPDCRWRRPVPRPRFAVSSSFTLRVKETAAELALRPSQRFALLPSDQIATLPTPTPEGGPQRPVSAWRSPAEEVDK